MVKRGRGHWRKSQKRLGDPMSAKLVALSKKISPRYKRDMIFRLVCMVLKVRVLFKHANKIKIGVLYFLCIFFLGDWKVSQLFNRRIIAKKCAFNFIILSLFCGINRRRSMWTYFSLLVFAITCSITERVKGEMKWEKLGKHFEEKHKKRWFQA